MLSIVPSLDTLSRLKGIETFGLFQNVSDLSPLDTLSRLKGIETRSKPSEITPADPLDTLSRLKGIETLNNLALSLSTHLLWIRFPV